VLDPSRDLLIKFIEAAPERGIGWRKFWQYGCESGAEKCMAHELTQELPFGRLLEGSREAMGS